MANCFRPVELMNYQLNGKDQLQIFRTRQAVGDDDLQDTNEKEEVNGNFSFDSFALRSASARNCLTQRDKKTYDQVLVAGGLIR